MTVLKWIGLLALSAYILWMLYCLFDAIKQIRNQKGD